MMLPAGLASINRTRWDSGSTNLPAGVLPLSSEDEAALIKTLIEELNANLKMDLDLSLEWFSYKFGTLKLKFGRNSSAYRKCLK